MVCFLRKSACAHLRGISSPLNFHVFKVPFTFQIQGSVSLTYQLITSLLGVLAELEVFCTVMMHCCLLPSGKHQRRKKHKVDQVSLTEASSSANEDETVYQFSVYAQLQVIY